MSKFGNIPCIEIVTNGCPLKFDPMTFPIEFIDNVEYASPHGKAPRVKFTAPGINGLETDYKAAHLSPTELEEALKIAKKFGLQVDVTPCQKARAESYVRKRDAYEPLTPKSVPYRVGPRLWLNPKLS